MSLDTAIPDARIARGSPLGMPPSLAYSGSPEASGSLVTVGPPPQTSPGMRDGRKQRVVGLVPARAGAQFPMIRREAPRVRVDPREVSKTRAELRRAHSAARAKEAALIAHGVPTSAPTDDYKTALLAARDANDLVAALTRKLGELDASSAARPLSVVTAIVREPAEVADEIAHSETRYKCLHDGCKSESWADEAAMRRAHPTDAEMKRAQQCHVFVLMCEAPLDPLDPDGEIIGYVAPVGSDGTTIKERVAQADAAAGFADADEVADLRAKVEVLMAQIAEMAGKPGKK